MTPKADRSDTIFLAGASGAIGRPLCRLLVAGGWRVFGTTRSPEKAALLRSLGVEPVVVDAFDAEALREAALAAGARIVISQLTDLPPGLDPKRMPAARERNARLREIGTRNLIAAGLAGGTGGPVHVDAAADAARRAVTTGSPGIYNVAEDDGPVSSARAAGELGWRPDFRVRGAGHAPRTA